MSCSTYVLKAYLFGEATEEERRCVAGHAASCAACSEELERLRTTHAALMSVPEEEIPRRIAFVSDKVFEPRWWQRFFQSGSRVGFASAAMLSLAILAHGYIGPSGPESVEQAVQKAVAEAEQRLEARRQTDLLAVQETYEVLAKRLNIYMTAYRGSL